jgi:hypothetical protein
MWRSDGRSLLVTGVLNLCLGGFILAPEGWPRYLLAAAFLGAFVWSMVGTPREVLTRYRWGWLLAGIAAAGILLVTFSPALVAGNERLARNVTGVVALAALLTLAFLSIQDIRGAAKQKR